MGAKVTVGPGPTDTVEVELARVRQDGKVWVVSSSKRDAPWFHLTDTNMTIGDGLQARLERGLFRRHPKLVCQLYGPARLHSNKRGYSVTLEPGHEYALGATGVLTELNRYTGV